jgi:mono/diheme cytochrome c family protein
MLRNTFLLTAVLALVSAIAFAIQVRERDAAWAAPSEAALKVNPLATRPDAVAGGRKLFHQRCSTCHGKDGRGSAKAPDLTQADVQAQTDGALFWKISSGNSHQGMPSFSFLPEPERWQLVLHIRAAARSSRRDVEGGCLSAAANRHLTARPTL